MFPSNVVGAVTGTGSAINVEVGFIPDLVRLLNQTSGKTLLWYRTQGAGYGLIGGAGTTAAIITSNGVSAYNGAPNAGLGFTIGTDSINTAGQVIAYELVRSGPGAK